MSADLRFNLPNFFSFLPLRSLQKVFRRTIRTDFKVSPLLQAQLTSPVLKLEILPSPVLGFFRAALHASSSADLNPSLLLSPTAFCAQHLVCHLQNRPPLTISSFAGQIVPPQIFSPRQLYQFIPPISSFLCQYAPVRPFFTLRLPKEDGGHRSHVS